MANIGSKKVKFRTISIQEARAEAIASGAFDRIRSNELAEQNAISVREALTSAPIPLVYGIYSIPGLEVYSDSRNSWPLSASNRNGNITHRSAELSGLLTATTGMRRQVLAKQDVLTMGSILDVTFAVVDGEAIDNIRFRDGGATAGMPNAWGNFYQPGAYQTNDPVIASVGSGTGTYSFGESKVVPATIRFSFVRAGFSQIRRNPSFASDGTNIRVVYYDTGASEWRMSNYDFTSNEISGTVTLSPQPTIYYTGLQYGLYFFWANGWFIYSARSRRNTGRFPNYNGLYNNNIYSVSDDGTLVFQDLGSGTELQNLPGTTVLASRLFSIGTARYMLLSGRIYPLTGTIPSLSRGQQIGRQLFRGSSNVSIFTYQNKNLAFFPNNNIQVYEINASRFETFTELGAYPPNPFFGGISVQPLNVFSSGDELYAFFAEGNTIYELGFPQENQSRVGSFFTGVASATWGFYLNLTDPAYRNIPDVTYFLRGKTVQSIAVDTSTDPNTYSLGFTGFSCNGVRVLLNYIIGENNSYGGLVSGIEEVDLPSFHAAQQFADQYFGRQVLNGNFQSFLGVSYPAARNSAANTTYVTYGQYVEANTEIGNLTPDGLVYQNIDRHSSESTTAATRDWLAQNMLRRLAFNGIISSSSDLQEVVIGIQRSLPGLIIFQDVFGRYKISHVDPNKAIHSAATVDEVNLIGDFSVEIPPVSQRINRVSVTFPNIVNDYALDTVEFPGVNSVLDLQLQEADGLVLKTDIRPNGVNNLHHAISLSAHRILLSRRETYRFTTNHRYFLLEIGDVVRLNVSDLGLDVWARIVEKQLNTDFTINWEAIRFSRWDYDLYLTDQERIPLDAESPTGIRRPTTLSVSISGESAPSGGSTEDYTAAVSGSATGAITYAWTVPQGVTIVSGQTGATLRATFPAATNTEQRLTLSLVVTRGGLRTTNSITVVIAATAQQPAADTTAPTFVSAALSADGNYITATYSEDLDPDHIPALTAFTVLEGTSRKSGAPHPSASGSNAFVISGRTIEHYYSVALSHSSTITYAYTNPGDSSALQDAAGNEVASFGAQTVTTTATPAPTGSPSLSTSGITASAITWSWSAIARATSYEVNLDSAGWTDIGNNLSHTESSLTAGTAYTLQVRAKNSSGTGPAASLQATTLAAATPTLTVGAVTRNNASPVAGDTVRFTAPTPGGSATGTITYQWQLLSGSTWGDISGETSQNYDRTEAAAATTVLRVGLTRQGVTTYSPQISTTWTAAVTGHGFSIVGITLLAGGIILSVTARFAANSISQSTIVGLADSDGSVSSVRTYTVMNQTQAQAFTVFTSDIDATNGSLFTFGSLASGSDTTIAEDDEYFDVLIRRDGTYDVRS